MKETIGLAVKLLIITAIAALVLAAANSFTKPIIDERAAQEYAEAMKKVYPDADSFKALDKAKLDAIKAGNKNVADINIALKGGQEVGYVFKTIGKGGYAGDIEMILGINKADLKITGYEVLKMNETPGLGTVVGDPEYVQTVVGNIADEHLIKANPPSGENDIQAITGTTISVNAVLNGLNGAIDALQAIME